MKGNQTNEMHFEAKLCDSFFEEKKKKKGKEKLEMEDKSMKSFDPNDCFRPIMQIDRRIFFSFSFFFFFNSDLSYSKCSDVRCRMPGDAVHAIEKIPRVRKFQSTCDTFHKHLTGILRSTIWLRGEE